MAESMMQKLTKGDAAKGQRPLDKWLALGVTLLTGLFLFALVFSSLSGTYTTIGQKAAVAVVRQTVTSILEKGTDQAQVEAYLKIVRGAYPELAAVRLYTGNTAVHGGTVIPPEEKNILGDLATFHKNNNVEEYRIAGSSLAGYMMPLVQSGDYWTMSLVFSESGALRRAIPFLIVGGIVLVLALLLMLRMLLARGLPYVKTVSKYFTLAGMAVYILASHFLLVGLDGDWTTRGNDLAFHSVHYLLNNDIIEGKAAIEAAQQGIPDAVKAYRDALAKYQDQLTDAEMAIKRAKDDLDVAKRDRNTKLEEDANRRLTEATAKKTEAEGVITPAADQLKMQKATIEGYLNPVLQGRVGGAHKSGFNRMLDGNDVPRFAIAYARKGAFQIVVHPEVDGLRPWLTIALLLLAAVFIVQMGIGAGVIVEKKFAGVKTFFYYFFLEAFVLICMLPVIWIMVASFFSETGIKSIISTIKDSEIFIKNFISLENYQKNLEGMFLTYFRNSLVVSGVTAVFCGGLGILAGYAFSRFYFPGRRKQMMWILVSQLFPMAMMIVPLYIVSQVLGINKGLFVIIIAYSATSLPFSIWMMKGYFDTVPISLEEAAAIDGASTARRMWHVLLPLSRPAIATTIFYSFITSWNEFAISSFFLNTKETRTLPVALNAMLDSFNPQYALFSAAGVLASLPVVVLFLYLQKHLVSGLMAGGVKG